MGGYWSQMTRSAHAHLIYTWCTFHFGLRVRIFFWPAHAHLIFACACTPHLDCARASHFDLRMRISFTLAHAFWPAHLIFACVSASHFCLRVRTFFRTCACASHFGLRMRISFWSARAHLILACACAFNFYLFFCSVLRASHFGLHTGACARHRI